MYKKKEDRAKIDKVEDKIIIKKDDRFKKLENKEKGLSRNSFKIIKKLG